MLWLLFNPPPQPSSAQNQKVLESGEGDIKLNEKKWNHARLSFAYKVTGKGRWNF